METARTDIGYVPAQPARLVIAEDDAAPLEALRHGYGRHLGLGGGIDIRI